MVSETEWKLLLIRQRTRVGKLPDESDVYCINRVTVLPLCLDEPKDLDIEVFVIEKGRKRNIFEILSSVFYPKVIQLSINKYFSTSFDCYRPQGKIMFSQPSVILSTWGGAGWVPGTFLGGSRVSLVPGSF